ncbi:hypothetical protein AVEN_127172-1 [Araneus ventricosus]|uniref:Uncharacterized protein n=1 Tax=Araneus ventricosus TaxID=182803 RepID=A0A4Y2FPR4_ARAVE|nr:hypothetical protein AVEN_127172-1 [Araneus ventricosus]
MPEHITVQLPCDGTGLDSICSYLFKKIRSNDKGSRKTTPYCIFVRTQGLFLDSVRVFHCTNLTFVRVNVPIEVKVGFVIPQNVPWSSDVNYHSSKELKCKSCTNLSGDRPAIGAQAGYCRDKISKSAVRFFLTVEYGISNTRETTGILTLPCGNSLLASTTAVTTSSTLEDGICFRSLPGTMPSCPVVSNCYIILRRAHGDIGPLRIRFIRRNSFTAATEFCWFR